MNPNDLMAQQQVYLNQVLQNVQQLQIVFLVISIAMFLLGSWVTYMFYARLQDIADELRAFRIAYQMVHDRRQPGGSLRKPTQGSPNNPFQEGEEDHSKPKAS